MKKDYWSERWEKGDTGWHQKEVEPVLIQNFSGLAPTRVLVPLCGKSLDLSWLASRGHEVLGIELSALACEAYFSEQQLKFEIFTQGRFKVYRSGAISLFNGDFFDLSPADLGSIGAVYDRAALIALPKPVRKQYAHHLKHLVCMNGKNELSFLQVVLERKSTDDKGPPFSVTAQELKDLYSDAFRIQLVNCEEVDIDKDGSERVKECVYLLNRLA